jgi:hypothetical protein
VSERNLARGYDPIYPLARYFGDENECTLADRVSASFGRITQNKLSVSKSVYFGISFLAGSKSSDISNC